MFCKLISVLNFSIGEARRITVTSASLFLIDLEENLQGIFGGSFSSNWLNTWNTCCARKCCQNASSLVKFWLNVELIGTKDILALLERQFYLD